MNENKILRKIKDKYAGKLRDFDSEIQFVIDVIKLYEKEKENAAEAR